MSYLPFMSISFHDFFISYFQVKIQLERKKKNQNYSTFLLLKFVVVDFKQ